MGRRSRAIQARRQAAAAAAAPTPALAGEERVDARAAGRAQAYHDAYQHAQARAQARRQRPRGPWQARGARIVRAAVSDHEWQQLAALAAAHNQPASAYLGQLIRAHLHTNSQARPRQARPSQSA